MPKCCPINLALLVLVALQISIATAQDTVNIFEATQLDSAAAIHAALSAGADPNAIDEYGQTPIMYAIEHNSIEAVQALITAGANVNARTIAQWTPLMYAARNPNPEITRILLAAGANATATAADGSAPLSITADYSNEEVRGLLLEGLAQEQLEFEVGDQIVIIDGPLRLRDDPSFLGRIITTLETNDVITIKAETPKYEDGFWWWHVETLNTDGFVAQGPKDAPYIAEAISSNIAQPAAAALAPGTVPATEHTLHGAWVGIFETPLGVSMPLRFVFTDTIQNGDVTRFRGHIEGPRSGTYAHFSSFENWLGATGGLWQIEASTGALSGEQRGNRVSWSWGELSFSGQFLGDGGAFISVQWQRKRSVLEDTMITSSTIVYRD